MQIKTGIFDLGKVVVHSNDQLLLDDVQKTLSLTDKQIKKVANEIRDLIGTGQISEEEYLKKFLQELKIKKDAPSDLLQRTFKRDFRIFEDTKTFLIELRNKGIKLAALSNTIPQHVKVMEDEGVFDYFDIRVLSCEVGLKKPDPRIYKLTLDRLGVQPNQAFFTDDKIENVKAAEEVGINGILFENANKLREDLKKLGLII